MPSLLPGGRILVAVEPVDGRKGIDSLAGVYTVRDLTNV